MKFRTTNQAYRTLFFLFIVLASFISPSLAQTTPDAQPSPAVSQIKISDVELDILIAELDQPYAFELLLQLMGDMTPQQFDRVCKAFEASPEAVKKALAPILIRFMNQVTEKLLHNATTSKTFIAEPFLVSPRYSNDYLDYYQQIAGRVEQTAESAAEKEERLKMEERFRITQLGDPKVYVTQKDGKIIYTPDGGAIVPSVSRVDNEPAPRCVRIATEEEVNPHPAPRCIRTAADDKPWTGFIEAGTTLNSEDQFGQVNLSLTKGDWWLWAQKSPTYAQFYGGRRFVKGPIEVGIGVGLEQDKNPFRLGGYFFTAKGRFSELELIEFGGSGFWYRNESNFKVSEKWSLGFFSQRFDGSGLRIGRMLPKKFEIWAAILGRKDGPNLVGGLRRNF